MIFQLVLLNCMCCAVPSKQMPQPGNHLWLWVSNRCLYHWWLFCPGVWRLVFQRWTCLFLPTIIVWKYVSKLGFVARYHKLLRAPVFGQFRVNLGMWYDGLGCFLGGVGPPQITRLAICTLINLGFFQNHIELQLGAQPSSTDFHYKRFGDS